MGCPPPSRCFSGRLRGTLLPDAGEPGNETGGSHGREERRSGDGSDAGAGGSDSRGRRRPAVRAAIGEENAQGHLPVRPEDGQDGGRRGGGGRRKRGRNGRRRGGKGGGVHREGEGSLQGVPGCGARRPERGTGASGTATGPSGEIAGVA